jgi:hypothetical protein
MTASRPLGRKALNFEEYLKSPSGRAFAKKDSEILRHLNSSKANYDFKMKSEVTTLP